MKQYLKTFGLALLAMLSLAACITEENECPSPQAVDVLTRFGVDGKAWLKVEIPLATQSSLTRTTFVDGDAGEYAIHNIFLVLFHGSSESDAVVASTYNITSWGERAGNGQVTTILQVSSDNIEHGDNIYLLAVINAQPAITTGMTFAQVSSLQTAITDGDGYFVMSNAPLADTNDGTGSVSTLVYMQPTFFFTTEEEATQNPAASVYVERAAAKVTVTESVSPKSIKGNTNIDFTTTDIFFAVDNYNATGYLLRHFNTDWLSYSSSLSTGLRFVEAAALPNLPLRYRTYWAEDANYSSVATLSRLSRWLSLGESEYCAENTFDVTHMQDDCTTSVVVALALNGGNDFYTTSVTGSDVIYQPPQNDICEEGTGADQSFAPRRSHYVTTAKTIDEYLREWLMETNKDFRDWVNKYAAGEPREVSIAVQTDDENGLMKAHVTSVTQKARTSGEGATAFNNLSLVNYLNENINIQYYKNGYCYYRVLIRHFDDTQAWWQSAASMTGSTTAEVYDTADATTAANNYLGRYGVVRNNSYNIDIRSISHVGIPIVPPLTTDADDKVEQLLNATLTINVWTTNNQTIGE